MISRNIVFVQVPGKGSLFYESVVGGICFAVFFKVMKPVEIPIQDVLDLHTFQPAEVPDLLCDYFTACIEKKIFSVRIVHGKGRGVLKQRVRRLLEKNPNVASFKDAPAEAGGWGATIVALKPPV